MKQYGCSLVMASVAVCLGACAGEAGSGDGVPNGNGSEIPFGAGTVGAPRVGVAPAGGGPLPAGTPMGVAPGQVAPGNNEQPVGVAPTPDDLGDPTGQPPQPLDPLAPAEMPNPVGAPVPTPQMPAEPVMGPRLFLLTHTELRNSLQVLIGGAELNADEVQQDQALDGFSSAGAPRHSLSNLGVERWETAIVGRLDTMFANEAERAELVGCQPQNVADGCVSDFVEDFGLRAWRRPLTGEELSRYVQLATEVSADFGGDVWQGLRYTVQALLQSPYFMNRVYTGVPDPARSGHVLLTPYELATKLSFALTQSPPDKDLLDAAASGKLSEPAGLEAEVNRLLGTDRAQAALQEFCREWFSLTTLPSLVRDPEVIENLSPELLNEMENEAVQFCTSGLSGADAREAFQATESLIGPELAELYSVNPPGNGQQPAMTALPDTNRAGVLTSAAFLAVLSHKDRTAPTVRGRFVRERLLCHEIPEPPEDVVTELPEVPEGQTVTTRQRLQIHNVEPSCSACHALMDPIGFGLEHFDAMGRYREDESGLDIDATGTLDGASFDGAQDLTRVVLEHRDFPKCVATQWFRFSEARIEERVHKPKLAALGESLSASSFDFKSLVVKMALSEDFRSLTTQEGQ